MNKYYVFGADLQLIVQSTPFLGMQSIVVAIARIR